MALPLLAQIGIAAAPTIASGVANLFRSNKPTQQERALQNMADVFEAEASAPLSENRLFQEGQRKLDQRDEKNREAVQNSSAITGATDEARLASMEDNNEVYNEGLNRLFATAQQYRDQMRSRYLNTVGQLQQAGAIRDQNFQRDLNSIISPLSTASSAFLMSDIYSDPGASSGQNSIGRADLDTVSLSNPRSYLDRQTENFLSNPSRFKA